MDAVRSALPVGADGSIAYSSRANAIKARLRASVFHRAAPAHIRLERRRRDAKM